MIYTSIIFFICQLQNYIQKEDVAQPPRRCNILSLCIFPAVSPKKSSFLFTAYDSLNYLPYPRRTSQVCAISSAVCAAETNIASNCDGARYI